jgi:hypothetical protein
VGGVLRKLLSKQEGGGSETLLVSDANKNKPWVMW